MKTSLFVDNLVEDFVYAILREDALWDFSQSNFYAHGLSRAKGYREGATAYTVYSHLRQHLPTCPSHPLFSHLAPIPLLPQILPSSRSNRNVRKSPDQQLQSSHTNRVPIDYLRHLEGRRVKGKRAARRCIARELGQRIRRDQRVQGICLGTFLEVDEILQQVRSIGLQKLMKKEDKKPIQRLTNERDESYFRLSCIGWRLLE